MSETHALGGVWSATPTPLRDDLRLDVDSLPRLVSHHLKLGVRGLFLAGTCGEGPWLRDGEKRTLVRTVAGEAAGRLKLAVQVSDNSAGRVLDQIDQAREDGADIAILAEPYFLLNATAENLLALVREVAARSPLPLGLYNRGRNAKVPYPPEIVEELYRTENVVLLKDSSADPLFRDKALQARRANPSLAVLNGDEFQCAAYAKAGYDGQLLGGAIFNGRYAAELMDAVRAGDEPRAAALDEAIRELNWAVYGGREIRCWLSGLKYLMVRLGVFSGWKNLLNYPLTPECREAIDRLVETDAVFTSPLFAAPVKV